MDFATAEKKVQKFVAKGDVKGLQEFLANQAQNGMNPAYLMLLGQYVEAAALNIGRSSK